MELQEVVRKKIRTLGQDVKVLDDNLNVDFNPLEVVIGDDVSLKREGIFQVAVDWNSNLVVCIKDDNAVAVFYVYDLEYVNVSEKRGGSVVARGHETLHQYHFDDGEYKLHYTR